MGLVQLIKTAARKMFQLSGRTSRRELIVLIILVQFVFTVAMFPTLHGLRNEETSTLVLAYLSIGALIAWTLICFGFVRRLHDTNRSGHYLLTFLGLLVIANIALLSVIMDPKMPSGGWGPTPIPNDALLKLIVALITGGTANLLMFWWLSRPSSPGPNRYGPNPLEVTP